MPRTTQSKITNVFASAVGVVINWFDESVSENLEVFRDTSETESVQSMDSDCSGDLWGDWSPDQCDFLPIPDWADFNLEAEKHLPTPPVISMMKLVPELIRTPRRYQ